MSPSGEQVITSVKHMDQYAQDVAAGLSPGDVLLLIGELGAGKTTFVQGLARALGITHPVLSPTFTVIAEYPVTSAAGITVLLHADLYRLSGEQIVDDPAVRELLSRCLNKGVVTVVEWADRLPLTNYPGQPHVLFFMPGRTDTERVIRYGEA